MKSMSMLVLRSMKVFVLATASILAMIRLTMVADAWHLFDANRGDDVITVADLFIKSILSNEHFSKSFEAFAHLFVGGLIVAWLHGIQFRWLHIIDIPLSLLLGFYFAIARKADDAWIIVTLSLLTWVEIGSAVASAIAK